MKKYAFDTQLVHADRLLNHPESGAVHQATNNSVLFEFDDVADLEAVFQGKKNGHVYSRSSSGSVVALQNMLAQLEQGMSATAFATGMAAISSLFFSILRAGDHIIVSRYLFGNTRSLLETLQHFGVEISFVDVTDIQAVIAVQKSNTRMVFCESIANPGTQVADLSAIGAWCASQQILFVLDNTMTPRVLLDPHRVKADLLVTSLTKYIGGHGNVLGGAIIDMGSYNWQQYPNIVDAYKSYPTEQWGTVQIRKRGLRDQGASLAPSAAAQISVGLETLQMRVRKTCNNALSLAKFLRAHAAIKQVNYPGLAEHPQHQRATELFELGYGGILSFELAEHLDKRSLLNNLALVISATHLGDTRTLALPVATTIYFESSEAERASMGISDNLIRLSLGIENIEDLIADFEQALSR